MNRSHIAQYSQIVISHYDHKLEGTGYTYREINKAVDFIGKNFSEFDQQKYLSKQEELEIQNKLLLPFSNHSSHNQEMVVTLFNIEEAILLRCYISHIILIVGIYLTDLYSKKALQPFTLGELLSQILADDGNSIKSFKKDKTFFHGCQVLEVYLKRKPNSKISLFNMTFNIVKQSDAVEHFLLEHGVVLKSNWGILNQTTPTKLKKILYKFYRLFFKIEDSEIQRKCFILKSYHLIYRNDRRGQFGHCDPPNKAQLERMVANLSEKYSITINSQDLLDEQNNNQGELNKIAEIVREYLIWECNPMLIKGFSLDDGFNTVRSLHETIPASSDQGEELGREQQNQQLYSFLELKLESYLNQAIAQNFSKLKNSLSSRQAEIADNLHTIFWLLYCEKATQKEIEKQLGISQERISRNIIKPGLDKKLSWNIERKVKEKFLQDICEKAKQKRQAETPEELEKLDLLIQSVDEFFQKRVFLGSEENLGDARTRDFKSLYFQRLCHYLTQYLSNQGGAL